MVTALHGPLLRFCCLLQVSVIGLDWVEDCFWILNGLLQNVLPATCTNQVSPYPRLSALMVLSAKLDVRQHRSMNRQTIVFLVLWQDEIYCSLSIKPFWLLNELLLFTLAISEGKGCCLSMEVLAVILCAPLQDLGPVLAECLVLGDLLRKRCPKLLASFNAMDLSVSEISRRWFSHLFCGVLPAETTVRIWDCVMFEGVKVLFRVSLALLKVSPPHFLPLPSSH